MQRRSKNPRQLYHATSKKCRMSSTRYSVSCKDPAFQKEYYDRTANISSYAQMICVQHIWAYKSCAEPNQSAHCRWLMPNLRLIKFCNPPQGMRGKICHGCFHVLCCSAFETDPVGAWHAFSVQKLTQVFPISSEIADSRLEATNTFRKEFVATPHNDIHAHLQSDIDLAIHVVASGRQQYHQEPRNACVCMHWRNFRAPVDSHVLQAIENLHLIAKQSYGNGIPFRLQDKKNFLQDFPEFG